MRYLLSRNCRPILASLAKERTLCAFDFDGTLSPIVDQPERAAMRPQTKRLLGQLAKLYPCIIVSGRGRADLVGRVGNISVVRLIGNHGAETESTQAPKRQITRWKDALDVELANLPGVRIEDKGFSLAVHYRASSRKAEVMSRICDAAAKLKHIRLVGGKQVVNVVSDHAPHKGDAVAKERNRLQCNWVLYVGDDDNDEDAFGMAGNVVSVRIGRKRQSCARYYLGNQSEIDDLLALLRLLRKPASVL